MDKTTLAGIGAGMALVYTPIFLGDGWITFFDIPSIIMVLGGMMAALFVNYQVEEMKNAVKGIKQFFSFTPPELHGYVPQFTEMARTARREGLLALDRQLQNIEDDLLRFGLEMAVDGTDVREIDAFMEQRVESELNTHMNLKKVLNSGAAYAPAFGMIGTLVGLIQMMQNLTDPAAIGSGMAVAMITTFYGALTANLFLIPMAGKVDNQINLLSRRGDMVRIGVIAIVRGDSPTLIEKRLSLYAGLGDEQDQDAPLAQAA